MDFSKPVTLCTIPHFIPSETSWGYMIHGFTNPKELGHFLNTLRGHFPEVRWRHGGNHFNIDVALGWDTHECQSILSLGGYDNDTPLRRWMPTIFRQSPLLVLSPGMFLNHALIKNLNGDD